MKKISLLCAIVILGLWSVPVWAQTKPKLLAMTFYYNGRSDNHASYGGVTVELQFDKAMKETIDPKINYGLVGAAYPLNVPVRGQWENNQLWQGSFTITDNVPSTNDGEYVFKVYAAEDLNGLAMDTTYSLNLEHTSLFINRSGELAVSTDSLLFGLVREGHVKDLSLTLFNNSSTDLHISSIAIESPFSIIEGLKYATIPGGGSVALTIRFTPSTRAFFAQTMTIYSDDRRQETRGIYLSGSSNGAKIVLTPGNSIDFGWLHPDSSVTRSILVGNQAAANSEYSDTLRISEITTTDSKIFQTSLSILTLAPGDTKSVVITFTPKQFASYRNYQVNFYSNDDTQSPRVVYLNGDASYDLEVSSDTLLFGTIREGTSKDLSLTLTNNSATQLSIYSITISSPFSIVNGIQAMTIPANGSLILTVRFFPSNRAAYAQTMRINSSDRRQELHSIYLSGSAKGSKINLSPGNTIDFGWVQPQTSARRSILVGNAPATNPFLSDTLRISEITTTDPAIFQSSRSNLTIAPGDTKSVVITFTPQQFISYQNYKVNFYSNDQTQSLRSVFLNGDAKDDTPPPPIPNLRITWSGRYSGYFNGNWLGICWDNPNEVSGVAEIRWKFAKTLSPPTSPDDTTPYGGRYVLKIGETCISLPIFGRITAGRWYCYLWLVDRSGNSGYLNAVRTNLVYDITPPGRPTLVSRSVPDSVWFNRSTNFRLTITAPVDPILGHVDATEVRWKYKSSPTSNTNSDGSSLITLNSKNQATFAVPFNSSSLCGEDTLFYWLADSAGNSSADSVAIAKYRFDMCPPVISRPAPWDRNIAILGQSYKDTLLITDDSGVDSVWARYRFGGAVAEEPLQKLTRIANTDLFVVQIPKEGVTRRGIEFRIHAIDSVANEGGWPNHASPCELDSSWFAVRTRVEGEGDFRFDRNGIPIPLIAGSDEDSYQLFSVPYDLDKKTVDDVLVDDLGDYKIENWRIFDYNPTSRDTTKWLEGKNVRSFVPGRSYFLVNCKENAIVDGGAGVTRRTICPDTIRVYEGWNLIANPFNFPIHKSSMWLLHSHSALSLRSYERGWNIIDTMEPWSGYALYVTRADTLHDTTSTPIYLVVQPKAVPSRMGKSTQPPFELQNDEWLIQIAAEAGNVHDTDNWAGLRNQAADDFDLLEFAEPPAIGKYVQVAFPHPEWRQPAKSFSTDFRNVGNTEQVWNCEVSTNQPNALVKLNFTLLGQMPTDKEVYLLDEEAGVALNLKSNSFYAFKSSATDSRKLFKLIAGSQQFAQTQAKDISLVPEKFELLQNYPNPFNSETVIRFNLPQPASVRLVIYDMQGRTVRTLLNNLPHTTGYHNVIWNGSDDFNKTVATGVYLFKIFAGNQTQVQKMILLK